MPLRLPFVLFPLIGLATANRNSVGQLPIMGWSGYNAFMQNSGHCATAGAAGYNETTFLTTADALIKTGLRELGYTRKRSTGSERGHHGTEHHWDLLEELTLSTSLKSVLGCIKSLFKTEFCG